MGEEGESKGGPRRQHTVSGHAGPAARACIHTPLVARPEPLPNAHVGSRRPCITRPCSSQEKFLSEMAHRDNSRVQGALRTRARPQWDQWCSDGARWSARRQIHNDSAVGRCPTTSYASQGPAFDAGVTVTGGDHDVTRIHSMGDRWWLCCRSLRECYGPGAVGYHAPGHNPRPIDPAHPDQEGIARHSDPDDQPGATGFHRESRFGDEGKPGTQ